MHYYHLEGEEEKHVITLTQKEAQALRCIIGSIGTPKDGDLREAQLDLYDLLLPVTDLLDIKIFETIDGKVIVPILARSILP